jgi:hypothetical protein
VILVLVWLPPTEGTEGGIVEEGLRDINHMLRY